jgi:hypothetical protein
MVKNVGSQLGSPVSYVHCKVYQPRGGAFRLRRALRLADGLPRKAVQARPVNLSDFWKTSFRGVVMSHSFPQVGR